MLRLEFGSNGYSFFKLLGGQTRATWPPMNSTQTPPLQTLSCRPSLCRHPLLPCIKRTERGEGEEEKRREGRLGHVIVHRRRSSPKTGRDSFPLLVSPQFGSFPRCSWWFPHACCSLEAIEGVPWPSPPGKRWGIVDWIVAIAVSFVDLKGKP